MAVIQLLRGQQTIVDDEDFELLSEFIWHLSSVGYAVRNGRSPEGKRAQILMHRVLMGRGGKDGFFVDHINLDRLDNRKANLRVCTNSQNQMNRGKASNNKSGFKGVSFNKPMNKWCAQITVNKVDRKLGFFSSPEEAFQEYKKWAVILHGEFANFGESNGA